MEIPVKVQSLLKIDNEDFLCCTGRDYSKLLRNHQQKQSLAMLQTIINKMGENSAKAQCLKAVITNSIKFLGTDHRIYIKTKQNKVLGFIKVGEKNLFYRDYIGNVKELKPTCVLDIYVHQSCQRSGIGKEIFQKFLSAEGKFPQKLGYDRPSQKLIAFLRKHYGLSKFIPQNNNFVIFDKYFQNSYKKTQAPEKIMRPRSELPAHRSKKVQQIEAKQSHQFSQIKKQIQPNLTKRQFKQMQTTFQNRQSNQKNVNSQGFALSVNVDKNLAFRTTSNTYGNYYRKR